MLGRVGALTEERSYQTEAAPLVWSQQLDDRQRLPCQGIAQTGQRVLPPHQLRVEDNRERQAAPTLIAAVKASPRVPRVPASTQERAAWGTKA